MGSRSASEGEIIESDSDKATTAQHPDKRTSVNRRLRDALSPSPEASPRSTASYRSRSRSRSPYRAPKPSRGEKRRREDDFYDERSHNDSRRSKVFHDERRRGKGNGHRSYDRNRDLDYNDHKGHDRDGHRRPRTRSRSPTPDDHRGNQMKGHLTARSQARNSIRGFDGDLHVSPNQQSVSERQNASFPNHRDSKREAELLNTSRQEDTDMTDGTGKHQKFAERDSTGRAVLSPIEEVETTPPAPVEEVPSIEERRKRREAIKAKYRNQSTPLLVQALENGTDTTPATPQNGEITPQTHGSVSPKSSPATPLHDSRQGSPSLLAISNEADLAKDNGDYPSPSAADEPSAADYDPVMDMEEDRARYNQKRTGEDASAADYDETKQQKQDVLLPESMVDTIENDSPQNKKKPKDDMFASDDEDDMFAPIEPKKSFQTDAEAGKPVAVPRAKELDMSLLDNWDDHEGYYRIILGELLDGRYHVQANLGKGMFSSVVRATDSVTNQLVAIKIIRNNETMMKAGTKEIEILEKLAEADPEDKKHMIRLERSFTHKGHLCMVFENLSINLREVLKKFGRDVGINLKAVRSYAQQMFLGLSLLRKCNILHADLKPDNVLVNESRNMLKICDLGSAADASENDITPYLVSRFYRAPEVILGIPYDFGIDMWSIGCTLFELYTGKILFTGRTNNQMLRSIMECRGKFSLKMLKKAEFGAVHFDDHNLNFRSVERDKITGREVTRLINFVKPTRDLKTRIMATAGSGNGKKVLQEAELKDINLFVDLLDRCLALNAERRITPSEALKHPFIHRGGSSGNTAVGGK